MAGARTAAGTGSCGGSGSTVFTRMTGELLAFRPPPLTWMLGPGAPGWGPVPPPLRLRPEELLEGSRPAIGPPEQQGHPYRQICRGESEENDAHYDRTQSVEHVRQRKSEVGDTKARRGPVCEEPLSRGKVTDDVSVSLR